MVAAIPTAARTAGTTTAMVGATPMAMAGVIPTAMVVETVGTTAMVAATPTAAKTVGTTTAETRAATPTAARTAGTPTAITVATTTTIDDKPRCVRPNVGRDHRLNHRMDQPGRQLATERLPILSFVLLYRLLVCSTNIPVTAAKVSSAV